MPRARLVTGIHPVAIRAIRTRGYPVSGMTAIANVLNTESKRSRIQEEWLRRLADAVSTASRGSITSQDVRKQTEDFLQLLAAAVQSGAEDVNSEPFKPLREFLEQLS